MIQMFDPKREYAVNKGILDTAIQNVLNHGLFINGPEVKELEPLLAKFTEVKHAITVSNGTDALQISLMAVGVTQEDEVITVAHSWISTVEVISLIGAVPVFCDICPETFNMDHTKLEALITEKTKAIMPVSLYGQTADMDAINEIANKYNIPVIEDGAQSFGAMYKGKRTGNLSTIGTTSFFPSKPLGCYGDGGAIFTNSDELNDKIRMIKNHGALKRFQHKLVGMNARLDTIQAAILKTKLNWYDITMKERNTCAKYYSINLKDLEEIKIPQIKEHRYSVWAQYSLLAPNKDWRDFIVKYFKENGVNAAIFYPAPLHLQECFSCLGYSRGDLPITEDICDRIFNLPCYGEFSEEEQNKVLKILKGAVDILRRNE